MQINRGDMKLLTECGFSGVLRNIDTDFAPIFEALEAWMPEQGAGGIGQAMQAMSDGRFDDAEDLLSRLIREKRAAKNEARAMLAMVNVLRKDMPAAEKLAEELDGQGGPAENFAKLLVDNSRAKEISQEDQGPVKETAG